jgi:hypothetical protein
MYVYTHFVFHVMCPLFLSDFNETLNFLDRVSKNPQIPNFMRNRLVRAEFSPCGRTDGRPSRNLQSLFANFRTRLKIAWPQIRTIFLPNIRDYCAHRLWFNYICSERAELQPTVSNEAVAVPCTWRYSHSTSFTCIITMRILLCSAAVGSRM